MSSLFLGGAAGLQLLKGGFLTADRRLDRIPQFDPRSRDFSARAHLAAVTGTERPPMRSYSWPNRHVSDQGAEGACVGHGHGGRIANGPVRPLDNLSGDQFNTFCSGLYHEAQHLDEWPGEDYGTSVLGGAKAAKARGLYSSYRWAFSVEDVLLAIMYLGPVVLGISWLEGMDDPRPSGLIRAEGAVRGGHCIRARGVRLRAHLPGEPLGALAVVRLTNSWGRGYGLDGDVFLTVQDLQLLLDLDGEACVPVEPGQARTDL